MSEEGRVNGRVSSWVGKRRRIAFMAWGLRLLAWCIAVVGLRRDAYQVLRGQTSVFVLCAPCPMVTRDHQPPARGAAECTRGSCLE